MATRYRRAMEPLDAEARARLWGGGAGAAGIAVCCEGSTGKLEGLVRAFYNDEVYYQRREEVEEKLRPLGKWREALEVALKDAAAEPAVDWIQDKAAVEWIRAKAEAAGGAAGSECDEIVRRRVVRQMQKRGLDAGICKSQWQNASGIPSGYHEYIDAFYNKERYIVEINLAGECKIARPTEDYMELLSYLPKVFVGRPAALEAVISLMCSAVEESIKKAGMHVPPWRRRKYMNQKWFGEYQRFTEISSYSSDAMGRKAVKALIGRQRCRVRPVGGVGTSELEKGIFLKGWG